MVGYLLSCCVYCLYKSCGVGGGRGGGSARGCEVNRSANRCDGNKQDSGLSTKY